MRKEVGQIILLGKTGKLSARLKANIHQPFNIVFSKGVKEFFCTINCHFNQCNFFLP